MAHDTETTASISPFSSQNAIESFKNPFENNVKRDNFPSFEVSLQYDPTADSNTFETPRHRSSHTNITEQTVTQLSWSIDTLSAMNPVEFSPLTEQKTDQNEVVLPSESAQHEDPIARKLFQEESSVQVSTTVSPTMWHFEERYAPNQLHTRCQEAIVTYQTHVKDRHVKMNRFQLSVREKKCTARNDLFGCPLSPIYNSREDEQKTRNSRTLSNDSIVSPAICRKTNRSETKGKQGSNVEFVEKTDLHVTSLHSVSLLEDPSQITLQNEENKSFEFASSTCSFTTIRDKGMTGSIRLSSQCFPSPRDISIAKNALNSTSNG